MCPICPPDAPSDARLTLTTLGATALAVVGADAPAFTTGKPIALAAYLSAAPGRSAPREQLLDLLWGDVDRDAASHALSQTLWYARRRLGVDPFAVRGVTIGLAATVDADRDAFLASLERGDLAAAVDRYAGDFLPCFATPSGKEFDRWADLERARLRALFVRAAQALARGRSGEHRHREAVALARRARDAVPYEQGAWRLLLECLVAAGDHVTAAAEADRIEGVAAAEEIALDPATRALLRIARQEQHRLSPDLDRQRALVAELVGRERDFAELLAAWDAVLGGGHRHVHVTGGPGIGKSRLLADVAARLRSSRARVVRVQATQGSRDMPYALVADLAGALTTLRGAAVSPAAAAALVALNPTASTRFGVPPDSAIGADALRRRTLAVAELLGAVAHETPIAVLVDDVHWADPLSAQLLAAVATRAVPGVLLVTAARPDPPLEPVSAVAATIALAPLTAPQTATLIGSLGSLPSEPWADHLPDHLHAASGGSPLLALETLQLARDRGALVLTERRWSCSAPEVLEALLDAGGPTRRRIERLGAAERDSLALLALVGGPLPEPVAAHAAAVLRLPLAALTQLEGRGLALRADGCWRAAHDEIAATAVELMSAETQRAAHMALADGWAADVASSAHALRRAAHHLLAAGADDTLARLFVRIVARARQDGDRRRPELLADELLGDVASIGRRARVMRALPLRHRFDRVPLPIAVAAAAAAALVVLALTDFLGPAVVPPTATLAVLHETADGTYALCEAPFPGDPWAVGEPLEVRCERTPSLGFPDLIEAPDVASRPGGGWTVVRSVDDTGGVDLHHVGSDGQRIRLTTTDGDDVGPQWSPDGNAVAFLTGRWNADFRYDVAVLDLGTKRVTQLSATDERESSPVWSPDGREIAFVRLSEDSRPPEVCMVALGGHQVRCRATRGMLLHGLHGWFASREALGFVAMGGQHGLVRVDLDSGDVAPADGIPGNRTVSDDGRWVACRCVGADGSAATWTIAPLGQPHAARSLRVHGVSDSAIARVVWVRRPGLRPPPEPARRLTRVRSPGDPVVGSPYAFRMAAHGVNGRQLPLGALHWRSLDTAVATVTPEGELHPRLPGAARIAVSAAGASDSTTMLVIPVLPTPSQRLLLDERWKEAIAPTWVPFGMPAPELATGPLARRALLNNGDGSFVSGVYAAERFDARHGLVLDADISTRVTAEQWQSTAIGLTARLDERKRLRWDHRTGAPPWRAAGGDCVFYYAGGHEGPAYADSITLEAGGTSHSVGAPRDLRMGTWARVRLSLTPDGRCTFFLDGRRLWTSPPAVTEGAVRVVTFGKSYKTQMLVGRVTLRAGLGTDP